MSVLQRSALRSGAARIVALTVVLGLYTAMVPRGLGDAERSQLASRFAFERYELPALTSPDRTVRAVHPSLERIAGWISSVGAAIALGDVDQDGLPNDVCHVDPRSDSVIVSPAPSTEVRYQPFEVRPDGVAFDQATMAPMGCLVRDTNEDGLTDLLVYYWGRPPVAFLRTAEATDARSFRAQDVVASDQRWFSNAGLFADVDGDGHADLVIGNYFPDGAEVLDVSADGLSWMQHSMSRAYNGGGPRVLRWVGRATGSEPTALYEEIRGLFPPEVAGGWTLALGAQDLDGDLMPEIYVANDFGPDRLLHNRSTVGQVRLTLVEGQASFVTPGSSVLGRDSFKGMGVDFGDLNADGIPDMFVSNITVPYGLIESQFAWISTGDRALLGRGVAPYVQRSEDLGLARTGWGWDTRLADLDNDGDLEALQALGFVRGDINRWPELQELATGNDELLPDPRIWGRFAPGDDISGHSRNPFFVRTEGGFVDVAAELKLIEPQVSRGIATADVDGDGLLDYAVANQWGTSSFYRNQAPSPGAFLGLDLVLVRDQVSVAVSAGRTRGWGLPAIGATVEVLASDGRAYTSQVDGGSGHSGKRSADIHLGLGPATGDATVILHWRDLSGHRQETRLTLRPGWHTVLLPAGSAR